MNSRLKYRLENELSGSCHDALNAAVSAIYFNDSSDYLSALWEVVVALLEGEVPEDAGDGFINELAHYLNPNWSGE